MKKYISTFVLFAVAAVFASSALAGEKILFDFEKTGQGWQVPAWCQEKTNYVCKTAEISSDAASSGSSSMRLEIDLPGTVWRAGVMECEECVISLDKYDAISCDFYLPKNSPLGISAKLILSVEEDGPEWKWTETDSSVNLIPGEWVTFKASIKPGSKDWIRPLGLVPEGHSPNDPAVSGAERLTVTDAFRRNIRKVAVRIESDKTSYKGPVYMDNIKVTGDDISEDRGEQKP